MGGNLAGVGIDGDKETAQSPVISPTHPDDGSFPQLPSPLLAPPHYLLHPNASTFSPRLSSFIPSLILPSTLSCPVFLLPCLHSFSFCLVCFQFLPFSLLFFLFPFLIHFSLPSSLHPRPLLFFLILIFKQVFLMKETHS